MEYPLVSVIIPVYNVEPYLQRCLDSVCRQTYQNLEIILIEGNYTDCSPSICSDYQKKDARIRYAVESHHSLGAARDQGISMARGEWICFVDSDDFLHPQFVETLLCTVLKYDCLTAQCRYQAVFSYDEVSEDGSGTVQLKDWRRYFFYVYEHSARGHTPFGVWCNIYHRSLFENENVRFGQVRFAEDSGFTPRVIYEASAKPVAVIDKVLYYYYQREGSLLRAKASLMVLDRYYVKRGVMNFWREKSEMGMYNLFFNDFLSCMIIDYLNLCIDLPSEESKCRFLKREIEKALPESRWYCPSCVDLYPGARAVWEKISGVGEPLVLYGYGRRGKEVFRWLEHCHIPVREIWDQAAKEGDAVGEIPCVHMHRGLPENALILIAIDNLFSAGIAQCELRELGYENFVANRALITGIRYSQYRQYLPCLIRDYEELLQ